MRRKKRDMESRAYQRGYLAGLSGRSLEKCPFEARPVRMRWVEGWRAGRADLNDGLIGVSGVHRLSV
jgi:ribosome modulation factor